MAADGLGPARGQRVRSLRFRLTAVATVVVAVVLAGTALALLTVQRRQLTANLDASLDQRADTIAADLAAGLPDGPLPGDGEDRAVQLLATDGSVLVSSINLADEPAMAVHLEPGRRQTIETRDDLAFEDDAYRVLTRRLDTAAGPSILLVAGNSEDLDEAMNNLAASLVVTVPSVVALLAVLIWWLTGRTLGPVDTIRAEVDAISATNSNQRVHVPGRDDEIGRLAATMNRMLDRLDDGAERQRRFVADAAHELRTPLTRIRTDVEVDLARPDQADHLATGRAIRDETIGLQDLINDLLHLARSDAGQSTTARRPVDLDDIVMAEIRQQRASSDVTIDATAVSAAHLLANPDHLARAFRNLLTNATQHAETVVTVALAERDDRIELAIADDGPGIPPDQQDRIFDRFARVDDARTRTDGGTGLGLAIAREIVDDHGGRLHYEAAETGGARFVVTLPTPEGAGS